MNLSAEENNVDSLKPNTGLAIKSGFRTNQ
jgi:hypothetical protein